MLWLVDEERALERMVKAGKTTKEISLVLVNKSENAIDKKTRRLGLELNKPKPKIDYEAFKQIMKEEFTETCL